MSQSFLYIESVTPRDTKQLCTYCLYLEFMKEYYEIFN